MEYKAIYCIEKTKPQKFLYNKKYREMIFNREKRKYHDLQ